MDTKNLSIANILWMTILGCVLCWHVGYSLAQTPSEAVSLSDSAAPESEVVSDTAVNGSEQPATTRVSDASYASDGNHSVTSPVSTLVSFSPTIGASDYWASAIASAKLNLRAEILPDPEQSREAVERAADQLQQFLSTAKDERFANWLSFLRWNDLQTLLKEPEPDLDALIQLERNMRQNYLGLELSPFVQLRKSLSEYISALRFGQDDATTIELLGKRLDQLSATLQLPPNGADSDRHREIGLITSILAQTNQSPDLLQNVRGQYSRANVRVLVSNEFVQRQFSRPVSQPAPVNETILGTRIFGQSYLNGQVTPQLLDNPSNASLRLMLSAFMSSTSVGYNRSVKIHSRGTSQIDASETIVLTDNGLVTLSDTSVHAPLQTTITGIDHKLRIVRKIASKKAAEQKPIADSIARGRLENRVGSQFHEQLAQQLSQANSQFREQTGQVFSRLGVPRPKRTSWSSGQYLSLLWKQQDYDQIAAPTSCPLTVQHHGISVQIHQSAIMNLIDPIIGGRIIHHYDLDDIATQFGQSPSEEIKTEASGEAWSIDMAGYHPIEVEFDDQLVKFRIRTTKLDRGDQALEQPATIEAAYRVVLQDGALQLERQGDVKIEFAGRAQRGLQATVLRSFLKNKFDTVFKSELLQEPLRLSERLPANAPNLSVVEVQVDDGWIQATLM